MLYFAEQAYPEPLISDAYLDTEEREGVARPGWARFTYTEAAGVPEGTEVEWRMPLYSDSGHVVTESQPNEFYEDVVDFLKERGALD